jgi:glucokinase
MAKTGGIWIGFDLGGTKMLATVYDDAFKPLGSKKKRTRGHEEAEAGVQRMGDAIEAALEKAGADPSGLAGIGIGSPGPLDPGRGVLLRTPNLSWQNVPLRDRLEKRFGCPVALINDVDAGTYGEYRFGAGKKSKSLLGIFPGTGIGGGYVHRGDLLLGEHLSCMEIGHIRVQPDGPLCGCGRKGCLESVAGRLAIAAQAAAGAVRGRAPWLMQNVGCGIEDIRSGALRLSYENGDTATIEILTDAARWIGIAAATVIDLLAPDTVVLGGGLVEELPDFFVREVSASADAHVMPPFQNTYRVAAAKLGDSATALGAAAWARHTIEETP